MWLKVKVLQERVSEASRQARLQIKEHAEKMDMKRGKKRHVDAVGNISDTEEMADFGKPRHLFKKKSFRKRKK